MAIKQKLTPTKAQKVAISLQKLIILSKVLWMESANELDCDFKMPIINQFAKRIKSDAEAISKHLERSGYYDLKHIDPTEEYAADIWRIIDMIAGLDPQHIKEFADNLEKEFKQIVA